MADSDQESRATSPDLEGYTSAGDEINSTVVAAAPTGTRRKNPSRLAKEKAMGSSSAPQAEAAAETVRGSSQVPNQREGTEEPISRGAMSAASSVSSASEQEIEACYDRLKTALLDSEDELQSFRGLRLDKEQFQEADRMASRILKVIKECHVFLQRHDAGNYIGTQVEREATDGRKAISTLLGELRCLRIADREQPTPTRTEVPAPVPAPDVELQDRASYRAAEAIDELRGVIDGYRELTSKNPEDDDQLYGRVERFKLLDARASNTIARAGQVVSLALSCKAYEAEMDVQRMIRVQRSS